LPGQNKDAGRRELVREALRTIDDLQARLAAARATIAIVGIGCRYPGGADSPDSFWRLLCSGADAVTEVPADRWDIAGWYDEDRNSPGKMSTRWGGFLNGIDQFDAQFFGISPREAAMLDPQHRIVLETAWEALEHGGQPFADLAGSRTGVFLGMTNTEYYQNLLRTLEPAALSPYLATGNVLNAAAGRLAFFLGAHGPSVVVDTACSSSLTAVHLACQSLRAGDCTMALAGGVNVIVIPETCVMFSKWGMMAADGRCKAFDAAADGFVRGEGCGLVVLKRLDDALAAGDRVLAVIEGSAVNQDGRSSGLTVPNGVAQEALIRQALAAARVDPGQIDYVEAHGTGTSLGDPIEADALAAVFGPGRDPSRKLRIGSVKTNLGHTESASGVAGLIKCVLALEHERIPPQLHFHKPTPEIPWETIPIEVTAEAVPWPRRAEPRRAGVSSFGFSGANAHAVIAEAPPVAPVADALKRPRHILAFSARDPQALAELAARHAAALRRQDAPPLEDYCFTANTGRAHFRHRAVVSGSNNEEFVRALSRFSAGAASGEPPKVAFLFTGQGSQYSQYAGMGLPLYESQPVFRAELDRCAAHLDRPPLDIFRGPEPSVAALFALEWSLAQLWRSWGVEPGALLGYGVGEYVAACQSGAMSLEDGLLQQPPAGGTMAAVVDGMREAHRKGCRVFLEIGPDPVLINMGDQYVDACLLPSLVQGRDEWTQLLQSLGELYVRGARVDWAGFDRGYTRRRVSAPTYPFQRSRFWIDKGATLRRVPGSPLVKEIIYEGELSVRLQPWLADHVVAGQVVAPLTAYVEMALAAAADVLQTESVTLDDLIVRERLSLAPGETVRVQLVLGEGREFRIISLGGANGWILHASGRMRPRADPAPGGFESDGAEEIGAEEHYRAFAARGIDFGPAFRGVRKVTHGAEKAVGEIVRPGPADAQSVFHPALLDACLQPLLHVWPEQSGAFLPFAVERIDFWGAPAAVLTSCCRRTGTLAGDATVCDETGRVIAAIHGLTARPLKAECNWLYEIEWISAPSRSSHPSVAAAAVLAVRNQPKYLEQAAADGYSEAARLLDARSLQFAASALESLDERRVQARHARLLARVREMAARSVGSEPATAPGAFAAEFKLLDACGSRLADVLRGECDPLDLLFGSGLLEQIYSDSPATAALNHLVADVFGGIAAHSAPLRVLEIGAGTGGATAHVLGRLAAERTEYCFTDISPALVARARSRFAGFSFVRYEALDIEKDLESQGFAGREFDVILAANVLHATADLRAVLARVRRLLSQDGLLVLIEGTRPQNWIELTFGLTEGWWKFTDTGLRPDYPLLDASRWLRLLEEQGFASPMELGGPGGDYAVFIAGGRKAETRDSWLVFAAGDEMAEELKRRGRACVAVRPAAAYGRYSPDEFGLNPARREDYDRLLEETDCSGVAHAWSLQAALSETCSSGQLMEAQDLSCRSFLYLAQALAARGRPLAHGLWALTRGSQAVAGDIHRVAAAQAAVWGLGKVLALEHPELKVTRLDLDPGAAVGEAVGILLQPPEEGECALRNGMTYVPRLKRKERSRPARLVVAKTGGLDSLEWQPSDRRAPGTGEIEIQVEAAGLNFRDVLSALGMYPGDAGPLGGEAAGVIVATGSGVPDFAVGDAVAALAIGGFSDYVVTAAGLAIKKPAGWSFAEIVTVPAAFATAYHALVQLGRIQRGERVLIHSAAGGVGLMAVQLALQAGCEIIATAGGPAKRDYLRSLGIEHVFDSRSLAFADCGGVDLVLNSLSGDFIEASLSLLTPRGRFVELGKRGIWDASRVASMRPEAAYFVVDLAARVQRSPAELRPILAAASAAIAAGTLRPLPVQIFPRDEARAAFRHMAQARHIGKIVVGCGGGPGEFSIDPSAGYLITGGLSGLGLRTAEWLAARGAKRLALMARGEPDTAANEALAKLRESGVDALAFQGDVTRMEDVSRVLDQIPRLRGVIHSAGVLDDGALLQQDWARFERVLSPKLAGAWNLHLATRDLPLDFFVCYSSASAVLGSRGQGNHAAANACLDALAHHRRGLGLPALSINWGAWSGVGAAVDILERVADYGVTPITPDEGVAALERLMAERGAQAAVIPMDWTRFLTTERPLTERRFFEKLGAAQVARSAPVQSAPLFSSRLEATHPAGRRRMIQTVVRDAMVAVLGLGPDIQLDPLQAFSDLGFDSLTSIELRNRLQTGMGRPLPATLAFDYPTLAALTDYFCKDFAGREDAEDDAGIELLSPAEAEKLLAEELAKAGELLS